MLLLRYGCEFSQFVYSNASKCNLVFFDFFGVSNEGRPKLNLTAFYFNGSRSIILCFERMIPFSISWIYFTERKGRPRNWDKRQELINSLLQKAACVVFKGGNREYLV
jgi:hypothetical protein